MALLRESVVVCSPVGAAVSLIYTPPFRSLTGKKRRSGSNATDNNLSSRPLTTSYVPPRTKKIPRENGDFPILGFPAGSRFPARRASFEIS